MGSTVTRPALVAPADASGRNVHEGQCIENGAPGVDDNRVYAFDQNEESYQDRLLGEAETKRKDIKKAAQTEHRCAMNVIKMIAFILSADFVRYSQ
jgi:hypothetical protein